MHPQIIQEEPGDCPICGMDLVVKRTSREGQTSSKEREIAYWRAPMDPNEIYDSPGKSAMGMDLVPVYEDELVGGVNISIDPVTEQNMGIRTATVERGPLSHTIRTYGHLTYDETRISRINLKYNGWIEDLSADFTGQAVKRGEPLFTIYSPELVTAQQDLLEAFRNHRDRPGETNRKVLEAVRKRLSYYDIADAEIRAIEKSGELRQALTIRSPVSGVIIEKEAIEGDYIPAGKTVYKIADLSRIWVEAHIYEFELARVRAGLPVTMTLPYLPSKTYSGEVAYIYPYLQRKTRDVVLRLEFDNPDMELKPDMYADIRILTGEDETGIRIPSRAVLRSGERNIAFVVREPGKFTPREVRLGMPLDDGMVEVLSGLAPGETIVTSGQFLLDSESKLKEAVAKMVPPEPGRGKGEERDDEGFFDELETPSETQGSSGSDR
jgi:Cu(I)/Ag(I) efflux system membrane fusion protein/cobalt-zinc-cadmium efflux system membrane fusion protein